MMPRCLLLAVCLGLSVAIARPFEPEAGVDSHLWLEDVTGERPLAWVRARNEACVAALADSDEFRDLERRILGILDSRAKIPFVTKIGEHFYNFWRDAEHPKGLWRRTSPEEYRKESPNWETVIDLDALASSESEPWVWHGATVREPDGRRCLIALSRGGADADVIREFDLSRLEFVSDGFALPEAKSKVAWLGTDEIFVATDFGPGSLTTSGYPRTIRTWRRGTPLADATVVFEGEPGDMGVSAGRELAFGHERDFVDRRKTFFTSEFYVRRTGSFVRVEKPDDATASLFRDWLLLALRSPWTVDGRTYAAGSLVAANCDRFLAGERDLQLLFEPTSDASFISIAGTRTRLLLTTLENVASRVFTLAYRDGTWHRQPLPGVPAYGTATVVPADPLDSDEYFLTTASSLQPATLAGGFADGREEPLILKQAPAFFRTAGLRVVQHFAVSKDGTRVPYFQIGPTSLPSDGSTPTLLYGYGGFEIPVLPDYIPIAGVSWLERNRVYVIANIRGGGEFGPAWHAAAVKEDRHRAYEDFIAVAEDLIRRGVTSPRHLGIRGGSNGGLLMGNMYALRPDLFGAVVCQAPLLDMRRYHKLLAGASWMDEYGDPDAPEQWRFIRTFSPYHMVAPTVDYPPLLITASTRDDRVHPGHARKMVARLEEFGKKVLSYENVEGGHGGAADNRQKAFMDALSYTFLEQELTHR